MTTVSAERECTLHTPFDFSDHGCDSGQTTSDLRASGSTPVDHGRRKQLVVTTILIVAPLLGVLAAALGVVNPRVTLLDVILAASFYAVSGHGLTAGFHRMLTHRSFKAARWLKITLAVAGSLGMEGSVISWVANHRRHHAYTDKKGDPHSPYEYGNGIRNRSVVPCTLTWDGSSRPRRPRRSDGPRTWSVIQISWPSVGCSR